MNEEFKKKMKRKSKIQMYFVFGMIGFILLLFLAARFGFDGLIIPFGLCAMVCFFLMLLSGRSIGEDTAMAIAESKEKDKN